MKERIQKILGNAGIASRRTIETMVRDGRVSVNGKVMRDLPILVDPAKDKVEVDGETIKLRKGRGGSSGADGVYVLMNKPRGVYSTNVAQGVQTLAIDLLPKDFPRVYAVGRLDAETRGLLLLTNDGELTNKLTHPRYGVAKTYRATIDGSIELDTIEELSRGVWLADKEGGKAFKTGRSQIKIVHREREKSVIDITFREGRDVNVRRLFARLGHKVRDLTRIKMGPLTLDRLAPGKFRPLSVQEVQALREFATERAPAERGSRQAKHRPTHGVNPDSVSAKGSPKKRGRRVP
jgi:23S rRNA pseudouridine2605 synthase